MYITRIHLVSTCELHTQTYVNTYITIYKKAYTYMYIKLNNIVHVNMYSHTVHNTYLKPVFSSEHAQIAADLFRGDEATQLIRCGQSEVLLQHPPAILIAWEGGNKSKINTYCTYIHVHMYVCTCFLGEMVMCSLCKVKARELAQSTGLATAVTF